MGTLALEGMQFYAYHGYYEEEQLTGAEYVVDVYLSFDFDKASKSDKINFTINYEEVFEHTKSIMEVPSKLIEHIAEQIIDRLIYHYHSLQKIKVRVHKLNPPLSGSVEKVSVELERIVK